MRVFKYLTGTNDSFEGTYPTPELREGIFLVAEETPFGYRYLAFHLGFEEFLEYSACMPVQHFHEVILGHLPQKLRLDIDVPPGENIDQVVVLETILKTAKIAIESLWGIVIDKSNVVATYNSGATPTGFKISYHIIFIGFHVQNTDELKVFLTTVKGLLEHPFDTFIDEGITGKTRNFRLVGSTKIGSNRVKRLVNDVTFSQSLVTNIPAGSILLATKAKVKEVTAKEIFLSNTEHGRVMDLLDRKGMLDNWSYRSSSTGRCMVGRYPSNYIDMWFDRTGSEHCSLCNRIHDNDNTRIVRLIPRAKNYGVNLRCIRAGNRMDMIGNVDRD